MQFYPETNLILAMATIRRDRKLPDDVAAGEVLVGERQRVDPSEVVLRGARAGDYRILPINPRVFGVRKVEDILPEWIQVQPGAFVKKDAVLIQKGSNRRAPKLVAPSDCLVTRIEPDRFILQENPIPVDVKAVYGGMVSAIRSRREIQIEAVGALIQCAWGNGKNAFALVNEEPEAGLESLADEELLTTFRGQILLLRKTLTEQTITLALKQEAAGIIAPSMSSELRMKAVELPIPIVLTEGFGGQKMSEIVYNLLRDNAGRQLALDAIEPKRFSADRPEIFIPLPSGGGLPPMPDRDQPLVEGLQVRIVRAPQDGLAGRIKRVIPTPQPLDNGLRSAGAEIELPNGKVVFVPLANIEVLGRPADSRR
jgi:hypothetical protein